MVWVGQATNASQLRMRRSPGTRVASATAAVVGTLLAMPAAAQELFESALDCPEQTSVGVGEYRCTLSFTNSAVTPVDNVRFRVVWESVRTFDIAPALEPDGVPNLANSDYQDWTPILEAAHLTGPVPVMTTDGADPANRVVSFDVGTVDAQAARQLEFFWRIPGAFPGGTFDVTLETYLGAEQVGDPDRQVADQIYEKTWVGVDPSTAVTVQPYLEAGGRYQGAATVFFWNGPAYSQRDARVVLTLPDVVDPADIHFELGYRGAGALWVLRDEYDTAGAVPDGDGMYRFPSSGPNAGQLVTYDPATRTVTAHIGIIWSGETVLHWWDPHHVSCRLRWDAALDSGAVLEPDAIVQAQSCLVTDRLGEPGVCSAGNTTVHAEAGHFSAHLFRLCPKSPQFCGDEANGAYPPSGTTVRQHGETLVVMANETSATRDMVVTLQMPGTWSPAYADDDCDPGDTGLCTDPNDTGRVGAMVSAFLNLEGMAGPAVAPIAADAVRIQVSLGSADQSDDLATRVVPSPDAEWITCAELIAPDGDDTAGLGCNEAMLAALDPPVDMRMVEEVRFVFEGMRPMYTSTHDVGPIGPWRWFGGVTWMLDDDVPASIDGVSSQDHLANMAFGSALVADLSDFIVDPLNADEDYRITRAGEVTRESFTLPCGATSVGIGGGAPCPGSYSEAVHHVFDNGQFGMGVANSGTLDNVSAPIRMCTPLPRSFRLDGQAPEIVSRTLRHDDFNMIPVEATFTWETFDDGDPITEATYCVEITDFEGVPCSFDPGRNDCIAAGTALQARWNYRVVPGLEVFTIPGRAQLFVVNGYSDPAYWPPDSTGSGWAFVQGETPAGDPREEKHGLGGGSWVIIGRSAITLDTFVIPGEAVQPNGHFCYDYRIDSHAFLEGEGETPDPDGATLPSRDGVMYQWVARCDDEGSGCTRPQPNGGPASEPPAFQAGAGDSVFYSALSFDPDALAIWVHTEDLPVRGDATTLAANGWTRCVDLTAGTDTCEAGVCAQSGRSCSNDVECRPLCGADNISAQNILPSEVRWVAVEFGDIEITDAEPRGQAPFAPNERINRPYSAFFCMTDDGSSEGDQIVTVGEAHTSTLLPVYSRPVILTVGAEAAGDLLVNEVDYTQPGADGAEFIEVFNNTGRTLNLGNVELRAIDGAGGGATVYRTLALPDVDLAPGDYFVVCGQSSVDGCDLDVEPDVDLLEDGPPDAVALYAVFGDIELLLDTVSYDGSTAGYAEGDGAGLVDDGALSRVAIARLPDATDTNQNNVDLAAACITPGALNVDTLAQCDCGDGVVQAGVGEACDDHNRLDGDGCSASCQPEYGYVCAPEGGAGSCATDCGDGLVAGAEACDDGDEDGDDGCSAACELESPGWSCATAVENEPADTVCTSICGDGWRRGDELCDDGNEAGGDGCTACVPDYGYACQGRPEWPQSMCATICGDGLMAGGEACDDGDFDGSDGCSASCTIEQGWQCTSAPAQTPDTVCEGICGDGLVRGGETCDDGNTAIGDGCAACQAEYGYTCLLRVGFPESRCASSCGDGLVASDEDCDDGPPADGDGCSSTCVRELGFTCDQNPANQPDTLGCETVCGDGVVTPDEGCDDGALVDGDGCSAICAVEYGYACTNLDEPFEGYNTFDPATLGTGGNGGLPFTGTQHNIQLISVPEPARLASFDLVMRHDLIEPQPPAGHNFQLRYLIVPLDTSRTLDCFDPNDARYGAPWLDLDEVEDWRTDADPENDPAEGLMRVPWLGNVRERVQRVVLAQPFELAAGQVYALIVYNVDTSNWSGLAWSVEINGEHEPLEGYFAYNGAATPCPPEGSQALGFFHLNRTYFSFPPNFFSTDLRTGLVLLPQSACAAFCGDGVVAAGAEACDDGNAEDGDGCSAACEVEPGWTCESEAGGEPDSTCETSCGDGIVAGAEACDDGEDEGGDGCSASCAVEYGYGCEIPSGLGPSACATECGDGLAAAEEGCDDGNAAGDDGCGADCSAEPGWACVTARGTLAAPDTACTTVCGDGSIIAPHEECDDTNRRSGDGCSAFCRAEPDTAIASGPAARTHELPTFVFSDPRGDAVSFECSEDGGLTWELCACPGADGVTPCDEDAEWTWTGAVVSGESYVFVVRGFDAEGNVDGTPAWWLWTFDDDGPVVEMTACPPGLSGEDSATFAWCEHSGDVVGFLCYEQAPGDPVPGGEGFDDWAGCAADGGSWSGPLEDGASYTFWVSAIDSAGNMAVPVSCQWAVDLAGPGTRIDSGPSLAVCDPETGDPDGQVVNLTKESSARMTFSDPAADTGQSDAVGFHCRLDEDDWYVCAESGPTGSEDLAELTAGEHTFEVRAYDSVGHVDSTPAAYTFFVDETPPDTALADGPEDPTPATTVGWELSSPASDNAGFQCYELTGTEIPSPRDVAWTDCGCACGDEPPCTYVWQDVLEDNQTYTLLVRAIDLAGNADPTPATWIFTVERDGDDDGVEDGDDNCPNVENPGQEDLDEDGIGDACDDDADGDGASSEDCNENGLVDAGESDPMAADSDGDGLCDGWVPSPLFVNETIVCEHGEDLDADCELDDGETDPANPDTDGDGLCDGYAEEPLRDDEVIFCEWGEDLDLDGELDEGESDPRLVDSDGDCIDDHAEVVSEAPSDPLDPDDPVAFADLDGDGEADACDPDVDGDGLPNAVEDPDGDGALDAGETDPRAADTDGDGLCDGWVVAALLDPGGEVVCERGEDANIDGVRDVRETDPLEADTDGDCADDGAEVLGEPASDPLDANDPVDVPDFDGDGVGDACDLEADGDGLSAASEDALGTDLDDPDTDDDGLCDGFAAAPIVDGEGVLICQGGEDLNGDGIIGDGETSPLVFDTDGDCISDGDEVLGRPPSDPTDRDDPVPFADLDGDGVGDACDPDADADGLDQAVEDRNGNGRRDAGETDAWHPDSDGDGLCDGSVAGELTVGDVTCRAGEDVNGDGVVDAGETSPLLADTDGDCLDDGADEDPLDRDAPVDGGACVACGDGRLADMEGCDDGGVDSGDGCSAVCQIEAGWACGGDPSTCEPDQDGDGVLDANDNCPSTVNADQADEDANAVGDACEPAVIQVVDSPDEGCCATGGSAVAEAGTGLLVLVAAALIRRLPTRRRRRARGGE